jgi:hypothetical protein
MVKRQQRNSNACVQRVVWRKRGSNSPESLCEFASFAPVRAAVEAPPAPSRHHVRGNAGTAQCHLEAKKDREKKDK